MRSIKYLLILFNFCIVDVYAQTYFNRKYDYGNTATSNEARSCIELSNGDFLISGHKYLPDYGAIHFIRINQFGDTILTKKYPQTDCALYGGASGSLIKCLDGNFVQCGSFINPNVSNKPDALLIKLNEFGDTLWMKKYGGVNFDNANIVCQTPDSGFVLMGCTQSYSAGPASDFYMIKTDKNGDQLWQKNFLTSSPEDCVSGQMTLDGGFIMSGIRNSELFLLKTDSNGNFQWLKQMYGSAGTGFIKQLQDSTYLVVGSKLITGLSYQAYMAKINSSGTTIIWEKTYGTWGDQQFYTIPVILADGSIVIAGQSLLGAYNNGLLIKTDSIGNQKWLRHYYLNPSGNNYIFDLKHTSDNGFIMVGSGNLTGQDAWVVKVDEFGCPIINCSVGLNELEISDGILTLYPNPANKEINLQISAFEISNLQITVFNILGEDQNVQIRNSTIDISQLAEGVYFVSVTDTYGRRWVEKFVKQ
ncbi:MAG: repeat protein [Bacteroidetes bacterium]|jgi:hypothetical protein|nr:repeat protein [Bacteroidota bacterium]